MQTVTSLLESFGLKGSARSTPGPAHHPLDPLSSTEIQECVDIIFKDTKLKEGDTNGTRLWFKGIQLREPPKKVLAPYLDEWHAAIDEGRTPSSLPRQANILVGIKFTNEAKWYGKTINDMS